MQITDYRAFHAALQTCLSVVPKRSPVPILYSLRVEFRDQGVSLTACDGETYFRSFLAGQSEPGDAGKALCVNVADLRLAFPKPTKPVQEPALDICGTKFVVTLGGARSVFEGNPAEDFPEFPKMEELKPSAVFHLEPSEIKTAFARVEHAVSPEVTRYALNGVLLERQKSGAIRLVASDGKRLAWSLAGSEGATPFKPRVILRVETMRLLSRLPGAFPLRSDKEFAWVQHPDFELKTRQIAGEFPDYEACIPSGKGGMQIQVSRSRLVEAMQAATKAAPEKGPFAILHGTNGELRISVRNTAGTSLDREIPAPRIGTDSGPYLTSLNPYAVLDAAKAAPGETLILSQADPKGPVVLTCEGDRRYLALVMPMTYEGGDLAKMIADYQAPPPMTITTQEARVEAPEARRRTLPPDPVAEEEAEPTMITVGLQSFFEELISAGVPEDRAKEMLMRLVS